jgi:hypothetical protein
MKNKNKVEQVSNRTSTIDLVYRGIDLPPTSPYIV